MLQGHQRRGFPRKAATVGKEGAFFLYIYIEEYGFFFFLFFFFSKVIWRCRLSDTAGHVQDGGREGWNTRVAHVTEDEQSERV